MPSSYGLISYGLQWYVELLDVGRHPGRWLSTVHACEQYSRSHAINGKWEGNNGTELEEVKLQVAQANRVLADVGLASGVTAALGHASMRVPSQPDRFVVKGRQYALDALAVMRLRIWSCATPWGFWSTDRPGSPSVRK